MKITTNRKCLCCLVMAALGMSLGAPDVSAAGKKYIGGTVCDYLTRSVWGSFWATTNPVSALGANGFEWGRVWVTTVSSADLASKPVAQWGSEWKSEYWSSLQYTEEILRQARETGMRLNLVFFLSDKAAHAGVQDAPAEWAGLSVEESAARLHDYCYQTTSYFLARGYNIELYDIGNEIERGVLNFRPGDRIALPPGVDQTTDMGYMRENVWNVEAVLLRAAISGVKEADPDAKIVLHAAVSDSYPANLLVKTFFQAMIDEGVAYDYAGLSYPYLFSPTTLSQPYFNSPEWRELIEYVASRGKPVLVSEFSYPHDTPGIGGAPAPGYPFTPEGQQTWVKDFLQSCLNHDGIAGVFYWYADYCTGMSYGNSPELESSGLFASDTQAQPALAEFRPETLYKGDINADYRVTIADVILCFRMAVGFDAPDYSAADVNGDGAVDLSDLIFILRKSIGAD